MSNFSIMLSLCALLIPHCLAVPRPVSPTPPPIKTEPPRDNTRNSTTATTEQANNISNSTPNSSATIASSPNYSSVIPNTSTYTTSHASEHSSTVTSVTKHVPTGITRVQTTASPTLESLATQSASETTTSVSTASTTFKSSVATVHSSYENTTDTTPVYFTTETTLGNKTNNETTGAGLSQSEMSLTILFSVVLGVIVLIVLGQFVFKVTRNKHRSIQYTHHPLYNEDTGEQFTVPDDMLVISGGLYDGPQIYNSTVTALNEDQPAFVETPTQFRLEFLQDQGIEHNYEAPTFKTLNTSEP